MVENLEWLPVEQLVAGAVGGDVDAEPAAAVDEPEREPRQARRQPRSEAERAGFVAHAAEPGDGGEPAAGQRGEMQAVARVEREVAQIDERRLPQVIVGELE